MRHLTLVRSELRLLVQTRGARLALVACIGASIGAVALLAWISPDAYNFTSGLSLVGITVTTGVLLVTVSSTSAFYANRIAVAILPGYASRWYHFALRAEAVAALSAAVGMAAFVLGALFVLGIGRLVHGGVVDVSLATLMRSSLEFIGTYMLGSLFAFSITSIVRRAILSILCMCMVTFGSVAIGFSITGPAWLKFGIVSLTPQLLLSQSSLASGPEGLNGPIPPLSAALSLLCWYVLPIFVAGYAYTRSEPQ